MSCFEHCEHGEQVERNADTEPVIDGVPHARASSMAKLTDSTFLVERWQRRNVARGIAAHVDLQEAVIAAGENGAAIDRIIRDVESRLGVRSAASRGTSLHAIIAEINLGRPLPKGLGADTVASVDAYRSKVFDQLKLEPLHVEQFCVDIDNKIAGTFDAVFQGPGGFVWFSDLKTGAKLWDRQYPAAVSIQLATYQRSCRWCPVVGPLGPIDSETDFGLLVSLPVGKGQCFVDLVDLEAGRRGLAAALALRAWRAERLTTKPLSLQSV